MSLDSLQALFLAELKDVYHAEKQLVQALPRMAKAAVAPELDLGQTARGKRCKGMGGLIEEGKEIMEEEGR